MYELFIGISWIQLTVSIPRFLFMTKTDKTCREEHKEQSGLCVWPLPLRGVITVFQNSPKGTHPMSF